MLKKINFPKLILVAVIAGVIIGILFYFLEKNMNIPSYYRTAAIIAIVVFISMTKDKYFIKK